MRRGVAAAQVASKKARNKQNLPAASRAYKKHTGAEEEVGKKRAPKKTNAFP
jgi:hypothetical protein